MRNNRNLYFDIWRKANFIGLLRAYTKAFELYSKAEIAAGFAEQLDLYANRGRGTYDGSVADWHTAYTIAREFAVYKDTDGDRYELSSLSRDFLNSKITSSHYLANYLLNFNQLINGVVVHPVQEVYNLFSAGSSILSREQLISIPAFRLTECSEANAKQMISVLTNRMLEAQLLSSGQSGGYEVGRYSITQIRENCNKWDRTSGEFQQLTHNEYVDMISKPNALIYR